jgi:Bifunctional DNA primase/polymerase, N-terminal
MNALETALGYARRGWAIFPCQGKTGHRVRWSEAATADREQVTKWWNRWPNDWIGMATGRPSGLVVLDVDCKDLRAYGPDTLAELGHSILPETPIAHTLSGGFHVFFSDRPDIEIRNSIGKQGLGPGLDIRGTGGYVILPSPDSGYWWDPIVNFATCAPLPAPAWLGYRRREEKSARTSTQPRRFDADSILEDACANIRNAGQGEKWRTIRSECFIAGTLVRDQHLSESYVRHKLEAAVFALKPFCKNFKHAVGGYRDAFSEGLASGRRR